MTATYDLDTDVGKCRLAIGDTDISDCDLSDEEIEVLVDQGGSWQQGAVLACDALIARYAKTVSFALGPRREELSQIVTHYEHLRDRLSAGLAGWIQSEDMTFSWTEEDEDSDSEYSDDDE